MRAGEPVELDRGLANAALEAAQARGIAGRPRPGRARGTTPSTSRRCSPTLLLFVPLEGGESHTPDEGADASDIEHASLVVNDVLSVVSLSN